MLQCSSFLLILEISRKLKTSSRQSFPTRTESRRIQKSRTFPTSTPVFKRFSVFTQASYLACLASLPKWISCTMISVAARLTWFHQALPQACQRTSLTSILTSSRISTSIVHRDGSIIPSSVGPLSHFPEGRETASGKILGLFLMCHTLWPVLS